VRHFNSDTTRKTPATLGGRRGNNHMEIADVSVRAEQLERLVERDDRALVAAMWYWPQSEVTGNRAQVICARIVLAAESCRGAALSVAAERARGEHEHRRSARPR
jgi:hypothetical protein